MPIMRVLCGVQGSGDAFSEFEGMPPAMMPGALVLAWQGPSMSLPVGHEGARECQQLSAPICDLDWRSPPA